MFEQYTERARRVIFFARYHASEFGMMTIETEHLLLGLIREDKYLAERLLRAHGGATRVRAEIEQRVVKREKVPTSIDLPLSNECRRILAYADDEMERMNQRHVGTEHIFLGILREEKCMASDILQRRGLTLQGLRQEFAKGLMQDISSKRETTDNPFWPDSWDNPPLPDRGVIPDAETAKRIAQAIWKPVYGDEAVDAQAPLLAELKDNVWVVTGSAQSGALFASMFQRNGRILSGLSGFPQRPSYRS